MSAWGEPIRPRKLRFAVEKHASPAASTPWWRPMQGPHPGVLMVAPASSRTARLPSATASRSVWSEAGITIMHVGRHPLALEDASGGVNVFQAPVGARADQDLVYVDAEDLGHVTDVVHVVGRGHLVAPAPIG